MFRIAILNYPRLAAASTLLKIYTKTGDKGETGLIGGTRVRKSNPRIVAYGVVDELNSHLGQAISDLNNSVGLFKDVIELLVHIQNDLFILGSDLADPNFKQESSATEHTVTEIDGTHSNEENPRIRKEMTLTLEGEIDRYEGELEPIRFFILPGGSSEAALLHVCRSVARRAETTVVHLGESQSINPEAIVYLNRLSDLLFVLARLANKRLKMADVAWRAK